MKDWIRKIQGHWGYKIVFYIIYIYMMLNDAIKLFFFPKWADMIFLVFTLIGIIIFVIDIIVRCVVQKGYFPYFFFWVDCANVIFILGSAVIQDVSLWITLSFLKVLMLVKITDVIMSVKEKRREWKIKKKLK